MGSHFGRSRLGRPQCLNLDHQSCLQNSTVVRELMHTIGMVQEEPSTNIDFMELAISYSCTISQQQMIDYIHRNKIAYQRKIEKLEQQLEVLESSVLPDISEMQSFHYLTVSSDEGPAS